jgi:hypothetical protein
MTDRFENLLLVVVPSTVPALGGPALAGAAFGGDGSNGSYDNSPGQGTGATPAPAGLPP